MRQKKFLFGGIIVVVAIGYLGFVAFQSAAMYSYTVDQVLAQGSGAVDEKVRVNGTVSPGTANLEAGGLTLTFTVVDGDASLPIVYQGIVPDTFKEDVDVVVEGHLDAEGIFQADTILMKCPSRYEPE